MYAYLTPPRARRHVRARTIFFFAFDGRARILGADRAAAAAAAAAADGSVRPRAAEQENSSRGW